MSLPIDIAQLDWGTLILLVVVAIIAWFIVRAVFKLAMRAFTCGCAVIFLAAVALVLWRLWAAGQP